jgi:hypothetical protein
MVWRVYAVAVLVDIVVGALFWVWTACFNSAGGFVDASLEAVKTVKPFRPRGGVGN